ncbi:MAG: pilus assembly protein [Desulfovibrio sp.]|jgi:type IVB pilus formation R64 PilN family outer membrane protein|nr:pilus assembly protein [Desulfovibrio sp.]
MNAPTFAGIPGSNTSGTPRTSRGRTRITAILTAILAMVILLGGCAPHKPSPLDDVEDKVGRFDDIAKSRSLRVVPGNYLGARSVPLAPNQAPILATRVTLHTRGTLSAVLDNLRDIVPVNVVLASDAGQTPRFPSALGDDDARTLHTPPASSSRTTETPPSGELERLLRTRPSPLGSGPEIAVNHDGPLSALLTQIAAQSGYGWDWDAAADTVTFARQLQRTFTIAASPGEILYDNQLTNRSREGSGSGRSIGAGTVGTTVSTEDAVTRTSQTNRTQLRFDVWKDTERTIKAMLSESGQAIANQAAGTVTVRDHPDCLRRIAAFIEEVNARYSRQVSLKVNVWSLDVSDDREAGIDLAILFRPEDIAVTAGSLASVPGGLDSAAATVVTGRLKDSSAVLKALGKWGNASQVTSGGAVAMNNQPAPILNTTRHTYLAGSSTQTTDYGATVQMTPGEVTSGFAMTVIPHILEGRRVVLQYSVSLSSLDGIQTIRAGETQIQLPQVSTRAFSQRVAMQMGQTLVLAGFSQSTRSRETNAGLFALGGKRGYARTLLVITMEVENASPELAMEG